MNETERDEFKKFLINQASTAGVIPVANPPNESSRVKEVQRLGILDRDLSNEQKFSSLILIASYLTNSEFGFINILGSDIQQCKVTFGLEKELQDLIKEVPRDISVCQYSLTTPNQPLIIEDLRNDPRTKDFHKMDFYKDLRFYGGIPLVTSRGFAIGTLCVGDKEPKRVSEKEIECLRLLADNIVEMIEADATDRSTNQKGDQSLNDQSPAIETKYFSSASVLFADFVGFTNHTESLDPGELLETLNGFFSGFDEIAKKNGITKIKTIGDCYMCVAGIKGKSERHAIDICKFAFDVIQFVDAMNIQRKILGKKGWDIRIGIHSGPLISGKSGNSIDVWGDTVNIAARIESTGQSGRIHVSDKTANYLGKLTQLTPRGEIELRNKGIFKTYFVSQP